MAIQLKCQRCRSTEDIAAHDLILGIYANLCGTCFFEWTYYIHSTLGLEVSGLVRRFMSKEMVRGGSDVPVMVQRVRSD